MPPVSSRPTPSHQTPATPDSLEAGSGLKAFAFHGVDLSSPNSQRQSIGECPWCGKDKFFVHAETGLWDCKVCGEKGNVLEFLRKLHEESDRSTKEYDELLQDRGLLLPETLMEWQVCKNFLTGEWIVPGWNRDGKLITLYKYAAGKKGGKKTLLATAGQGHGLFGVNLLNKKADTIYVCEGPWDAMTLWETLRSVKRTTGDGRLTLTGSPENAVLAECSVVAAPGVNVWQDGWCEMFNGKNVITCYDSDHPKPHPRTGEQMESVGYAGSRRVAEALVAKSRPASMSLVMWGPQGYDPDQKDGYDVRDHLRSGGPTMGDRVTPLTSLLNAIVPIPKEWAPGRSSTAVKSGGTEVALGKCRSFKDLQNAWRKAMKWTEGLDTALSVMMAVAASTETIGDQLWAVIIGPPSCGKSTLCEALSVNRDHVYPKDTVTGLFSGYQTDREGGEDLSMAPRLHNKTLVIKDADTILSSPQLIQIMSQLRALYDRSVRTEYKNKMSKNYEGLNVTVLLCGTSSMRTMDASELGARFLFCDVVEVMDSGLEREIGARVIRRAMMEATMIANGSMETRDRPELVHAKQMTGGYLNYLRSNVTSLAQKVEPTDEQMEAIQDMAEFVAFVRARPSKKQKEKEEKEMSFRLISQLSRLAIFLAVVLNRTELDEEILRRVRKVAKDTSRGRTLSMMTTLSEHPNGLEAKGISVGSGVTDSECRDLLRFLRQIGAVEQFTAGGKSGEIQEVGKPRPGTKMWRMTERMKNLYHSVMGD